MQYKKVLEHIGFAPSEIAIYTALLELDSGTVTQISKRSNINRTSSYDVLEHLVRRGLVSKFKKKKKTYFSAGDPRRLLEYMDRESEELQKGIDQKKRNIQSVLPELMSLIDPHGTKPKVTFYEGEKGMREAYEDTLTSEGDILAYANIEMTNTCLPKYFPEYYKRRAKKNILIRAICTDTPAARERMKLDKEEMRESILLPDAQTTFSPEMNIYNDKVLVVSSKEKMAVVIESKELADLQRVIYGIVWRALKKK
jgi:sugar-specific transcriptional regulator TrmB